MAPTPESCKPGRSPYRSSTTIPDLTDRITRLGDQYCAAGGFGDVFRCRYASDNGVKEVAVKAFRFSFSVDENKRGERKAARMIRRELGIWKRLRHSNIVPFLGIAYGFGIQGSASLVSVWMPNGTLHTFLEAHDDQLVIAHRLQLLLDIASGLNHLHSFQIVHGDLSSNNVLVDHNYNACLTDFGMTTVRPGTLRWAAPERLSLDGEEAKHTIKSDIYSFGNIALLALSGKYPWSEIRADVAVVLQLSQGHKPGRPSERPIDDRHWTLIEQCWSSISDRPPARAVVSSLRKFLRVARAPGIPGLAAFPRRNGFVENDSTEHTRPRTAIPALTDNTHIAPALAPYQPLGPDQEIAGSARTSAGGTLNTYIHQTQSRSSPPPLAHHATNYNSVETNVLIPQHLRERRRQRPRSGSSDSSVPEICVKPPSSPPSPQISYAEYLEDMHIHPHSRISDSIPGVSDEPPMLYKSQLGEIFRDEEIIGQAASRQNEATARKLQREKLVILAHEEGFRMGHKEGLCIGRTIGYDELGPSVTYVDHRSRSELAPPVRTLDATPPPPPPPLLSSSHVVHACVPTLSHQRHPPSSRREPDGPNTIRPIPIWVTPQPISVPIDDGWIPRADCRTFRIALPPHELQRPNPTSRPVATEFWATQAARRPEPTPVPPPVRSRDYAYQTSATLPVPPLHTPSQHDLMKKRPDSSSRNKIYSRRAENARIQRSRENTSRNEHCDEARRHSNKTEAEAIAEQWRRDRGLEREKDGQPMCPSAPLLRPISLFDSNEAL